MPPTHLIPGAAAATPRPTGRAGPEDPAPARSVPARPREADRQPDPPPPRSRGPRRARGLDAAPGRPRADPAAAAGLFGPVEEPDNDDRRVLPPPGRRGPGTAPPGAAAGPGYLHPPAHGPDEAVASSAADAAVLRAHPDPRAKKTTAPSRNPFPTRASRSPALSRPIPARPSTVTASTPRPGRSPRHPATRPPTARTTRPHDPATPATGPDPRTIPRTTRPPNPAPHPGTDTTQPHPTTTPPTARKTPNTPVRRASSRRRAALPRDGRARNAARTPRSRGRHATAGLWLT